MTASKDVPKKQPKIIQIAVVQRSKGHTPYLVALDSAGKVWRQKDLGGG